MSFSRIAAVTGANKGIGLAIVRNLALQYSSSTFNNGPLLIYLTARDRTRGEEAIKALHNDAQLKKAKALAADGGLATIEYHGLDVSKQQSITDFAGFLKDRHPDGIDVVVNNAGIALTGFDINIVRETLQTNYHGTLHSTLALLPLLRPSGRLVNISSTSGALLPQTYSPTLIHRFRTAKSISAITSLMNEFTAAVENGRNLKEEGWPSAAYAVSKSGITGMTRVVAKQEKEEGGGRGILINSCCPGYVNTDMTKGRGARSVDEGARTPVLLAVGEIGGVTGEFWRDGRVVEW